ALYATIHDMERALITVLHAKFFVMVWCETNQVFSHGLGIFAFEDSSSFTLLQSSVHETWARDRGSSLETRFRYTPSDCFETFPFPASSSSLGGIGQRYDTHRGVLTTANQEGLTTTYNRFHSTDETSAPIRKLRALHVEMDEAVKDA